MLVPVHNELLRYRLRPASWSNAILESQPGAWRNSAGGEHASFMGENGFVKVRVTKGSWGLIHTSSFAIPSVVPVMSLSQLSAGKV